MFLRTARHIGDSLVERGILTNDQADQIISHCETTGLNFTAAGEELGILSTQHPSKRKGGFDFFQLKADFFPESTKRLIPIEKILLFGALPLGTKTIYSVFRSRKVFNIGFLDPLRKESVHAIEIVVKETMTHSYRGIRPYLILPDQFVTVLEKSYGMPQNEIYRRGVSQLEPLLWEYVRNLRQH